MFEFSNILPFTSREFFCFLGCSVLLILLAKFLLHSIMPYRWVLALISFAYLVLLFPKPIQFIVLIGYSYLIYYYLGRKLKIQGLLLPVLLLAAPLIIMKFVNIAPFFQEKEPMGFMGLFFQVAGLSYVSFKVIQLYIDEKDAQEKVGFLDFFNFTAFTPTLLIGPIDRYRRFTDDVKQGYAGINFERFTLGLDFLVKGLAFKFIFGEAISSLIIKHLVNDGSVLYHLSYIYSYLFYLFFDFAGYSLLAMAFGHFLGIAVPSNFDRPFLSVNPKEFWHHWHKTLGDWLNDYFFKPIFKELTMKKVFTPIIRQNLALFITFTLMGFWNGFELHYIVSGMLFGLYSVIHNYYSYSCKKNGREMIFGNLAPFAVKWISILVFFHAVAFAIYIFSGKLIEI